MSKKPLNIGLVGYGFMGRTHSNGYKRVNDFFHELEHLQFKSRVPNAIGLIRTGDPTAYGNIILESV